MVNLAELLRFAAAQHRAQNWEQAERAYRQALSIAPGEPAIRRELAWLLFARGDSDAALAELRGMLADVPSPAIHNELGMMLSRMGRDDEAVDCFQQAVRLDPSLWPAHFNLGNVRRQQGALALAVKSYHAALLYAPDDPDVLVNLGVAHKALGDLDEARRCFERVTRLQPEHADAWINLGTVYRANRDVDQAIECYRRALAIQPDSAIAHNNLGLAWRGLNRLDEAITSFEQAVRADPRYGAAHVNLGNACESQGSTTRARACFAEALRLTGADAMKIKRALTLPVILESVDAIEETRRRLDAELDALAGESLRVEDPETAVGAPAFALAYHGRDERETQAKIAALLRRASPALAFVAPHCAAPRGRSARRVKIGFVSAHFRTHTIGKLNLGLIQHLNRERFEVFVLRFPGEEDEMARRIAAAADQCLTLSARVADARRQIADYELDVLFYTDIGIDALTYYLAHARLAPVQCVTWGHPLTTGIPTLDYFISSRDLDLPESASHYTEKLVRLPHVANYYFRPDAAASTRTRRDFGLADDVHVYASLQSSFKLHPDDDRAFAGILRRDPIGRLLVLEGNFPRWTDLLRQRFRRSMPDVYDRVDFVPYQTPADFSRLLAAVDVLLDPLHFGGGETSYQSFAVGAPVVTLPSRFLRARITYTLYRAMGVDDLIAADPEDYVERAVRLAGDRAWRDQVCSSILAAGGQIFENPAGVRDLEAFFAEAVDLS